MREASLPGDSIAHMELVGKTHFSIHLVVVISVMCGILRMGYEKGPYPLGYYLTSIK